MTDLTMRPGIPEYTIHYEPEMQLWVVCEGNHAIAYCPEQVSARYIQMACKYQRLTAMAIRPADPRLN